MLSLHRYATASTERGGNFDVAELRFVIGGPTAGEVGSGSHPGTLVAKSVNELRSRRAHIVTAPPTEDGGAVSRLTESDERIGSAGLGSDNRR